MVAVGSFCGRWKGFNMTDLPNSVGGFWVEDIESIVDEFHSP